MIIPQCETPRETRTESNGSWKTRWPGCRRMMHSICSAFFIKIRGISENNKFVVISHEKEVQAMCRKKLFVVSAAIVVVIVFTVFFPLIGTAASPNVTPPPATLNEILSNLNDIQNTLNNIPPAWSQKLSADKRFVLVFDGAAVLDKETGLVWEQSPSTSSFNWWEAQYQCFTSTVGGRAGWHLPTIQELMSLVDNTQNNPALPAGHSFSNVQMLVYWVGTALASDSSFAYLVYMPAGIVAHNTKLASGFQGAWCVRGGQGVDSQ